MFTLYKKYLTYWGAGECVLFALAAAVFHDGRSPWLSLGLFAGTSLALFLGLEYMAALTHQKLLGVLYYQQRPADFVQLLERLCGQSRIRANVLFSARAYLSTGYCALGVFDKALDILKEMPPLPRRRQAEEKLLLASNRCSIYLYMGDIPHAREQYALLQDLVSQLSGRIWQKYAPSVRLLEVRLAAGERRCASQDADYILGRLHARQSAYFTTELNFLLGQVYLQLGRLDFARNYLEQAAQSNPGLYVSRQAGAALSRLDQAGE